MNSAADAAASPVLFLTHSFPRHAGDAAGSFILRLARALGDQGIRVAVIAPHAPGLASHEVMSGVEIVRFRYAPAALETLAYTGTMAEQVRSSWTARAAMATMLAAGFWRTARARLQWRPKLLHAHWWFPSGLIAAALARSARLPLVTTMHGSDVRLARATRASHGPFRWVLGVSARTTAVSHWLAEQAHEIAPNLPEPTVAPMPAATEIFFPGGTRDRGRLLFVGRLNAQKGIELLLRAMHVARSPSSLDVVGGGEQLTSLRAFTQTLGIAARVTFHGALTQESLAPLYRQATALVVPSRDEGLGLVAVEAQLCETPVIAFNSGGLRDIVQHDRTGILVSEQSPAGLAAAIDAILANPEAAHELGRAGRVAALSAFAPEAAARRYAMIYRDALAQ
jgi:glycosyltransferase involved in cell wall biosynthesis